MANGCRDAAELVRKPLLVRVQGLLVTRRDHGEDFCACMVSDESCLQFMKSLARLHKTSKSTFAELLDVRRTRTFA